MGSSPRGRGKPECVAEALYTIGLIPAWAGKTQDGPSRRMAPWAHPRVGGENSPKCRMWVTSGGSSPRGRGKRVERDDCLALQRLIPAWAGKTLALARPLKLEEAHPRVGGENVNKLTVAGGAKGSSPRGRGKQLTGCGGDGLGGLIPAWAGKTALELDPNDPGAAHPRVGGENPYR